MDPKEVWWLYEARRPQKMYGSLSEHDVEDLVHELKELGYMKAPLHG